MTQQFTIKKKGNSFVAYDMVDPKRSYGSISIKTGKFVGDTRCLITLKEHLDKYKNESLLNRRVSGHIEVTLPILKDLCEDDEGFPLNTGAVILSRKNRNFVIDAENTNYNNGMKAGKNITFDSKLFVDLDTFSPDDEFGDYNYKLTEEDLESKQTTATFYLSDCDTASGEDCFDFDNIIIELVVYVDGKEYRINKVTLED